MYTVAIVNTIGMHPDTLAFTPPSLMMEFSEIYNAKGDLDFEAKRAYKTGLTVNADYTYDHMKELVRFVYGRSQRTTLDSISISYNAETGVLYGAFTVGKYFMIADSDPYIETQVPPMPIGVPNPFASLDEIPTGEEEETVIDEEGNAG